MGIREPQYHALNYNVRDLNLVISWHLVWIGSEDILQSETVLTDSLILWGPDDKLPIHTDIDYFDVNHRHNSFYK